MNLRDMMKLFFRHWFIFVVIVILATFAAYFFSKRQPVTYTGSVTLTINRTNALKQSEVNYYLFDNYYENQAANTFSQTATNWFATSSFANEIYQKAGVDSSNLTDTQLSKAFSALRSDPSTITVSTTGTEQTRVTSLINSVPEVLQTEANNYNKNVDAKYEISYLTPSITQDSSHIKLNILYGIASGVILGIIVIIAIVYFKREEVN